ncbi:voltage-gated potassium channel [Neocallimastix californiae]|uniref:Voltage-gated potassium channel n=1 Tax=Neocallimastix californiae TaxID=1754190 RepID=A0A1Y2DRV7_9FUNG|nr:voltage-gated potassium channel [Neocallimastix californiae]|eukprot:ORY61874.1 voltage-gated potassium channel [Neocallimastix californiae]
MSSKNNDVNIAKQTINVLTVLLYDTSYIFYAFSIPSFRENQEVKYTIIEYLITIYYILEISIRYFLYTFFDITTYNRMDEFYNEKASFLNLSERQYRIITIKNVINKHNTKKEKKKKKTLLHLIKFFLNKMEIICLLNITPLFARMIINKSQSEIYNNSKLSIIISVLQYTRLIRFGYYIIHSRFSKFLKLDMLLQVFKNSKEGIISTIMLSVWGIIFFSGYFFFAETYDCEFDTQTEKYYRYNSQNELEECRVNSIIDSYWWAVVTIQCIGYGDLTPATFQGKIVNGCIVLIANMIFSIPNAILTIEFLDLIMKKRKNDIIDKAVIECENKIEKAKKKNFKKEFINIISSENLQNNGNTFIKYYNIHDSIYNSVNSSIGNSNKSLNRNEPTNIIDFFKIKKSNNSLGYSLDKGSLNDNQKSKKSNSLNDSQKQKKSNSLNDNQKSKKSNSLNDSQKQKSNSLSEYLKPINSKIFSNDNNTNMNNGKILKSSEILLDDPTTTIKYGLGNKLMNLKSTNPDMLKLNKIIKNQQYLNKITTKSQPKYSRPFGMEGKGSGDSYNSTDSTVKNRKNDKGEIEVEFKLGEVKYMTVREISKELYKLSMDYYAQCENEFSEVDEQSGTLYLLMKYFEKSINQIRKIKANQNV